ncbi:MAG: acetyl-CoA C-acetyltransferase [Treponema sp.]|jgi:acetyl-CoA C-acetyltransferase|nr:acetyl-CoA C-acetyltransferase [Treponema sp.]
MKEIVLAGACRTAIGKFGGALAGIPAHSLGSLVIAESLKRGGVSPESVEEVVFGNVLQSGQGQGPARQAAIKAGIPEGVPAMTINKICGSGLRSVTLAAALIASGEADSIMAGGTENMSAAPYALPQARFGCYMNNALALDLMVHDALTDAFENYHMGITAENVAEQYGITRAEQDEFAARSQQKTEAAQLAGKFKDEIVPVPVTVKKDILMFEADEFPRSGVTAESLSKLRPAFKPDGTVTAGNASGINDGAAAVLVMSAEKARELGVKPMAKLIAWASAGVDHKVMGIGPLMSTRKALAKCNLRIDEIDLIEANEAFAAQSIAVMRELDLDPERVNVNGGAIALGHPVGASGARILVSLLHELHRSGKTTGLATLCVGGGMGVSVIVQAL